MSDEGKKFVPSNVFLTCDKGAAPSPLIVTPKSVQLYDVMCATEKDMVVGTNITTFGSCACKMGNACLPVPTHWMNVFQGDLAICQDKPLLEHSYLICSVGGKIEIHFSKAAADIASQTGKALVDEQLEANAHENAEFVSNVSLGLLVGAIVIGVLVVATGGVGAIALAPLVEFAAANSGLILTSAVAGAVINGSSSAIIGYGQNRSIEGALKKGAEGFVLGGAVGLLTPFIGPAGLMAEAGIAANRLSKVSKGLGVLSMAAMGGQMYFDGEAYSINPSQENKLALWADGVTIAGIVIVGGIVKSRKARPVEEKLKSVEERPKPVEEEARLAEERERLAEEAKKNDLGNKKVGAIAEAHTVSELHSEGYTESVSVQNNSGHGVDVIARDPKTGNVKAVEVKANQSQLSEAQKMGGEDFVEDRLNRAATGKQGYGIPPNPPELKTNAETAQRWIDEAPNTDYEVRRVDVDRTTGKAKTKSISPWKNTLD